MQQLKFCVHGSLAEPDRQGMAAVETDGDDEAIALMLAMAMKLDAGILQIVTRAAQLYLSDKEAAESANN